MALSVAKTPEDSKILRVHVIGSNDGLSLIYQKTDGSLAFQKVYIWGDDWKIIRITKEEESRILWITKQGIFGEKWIPSLIIINERLLGGSSLSPAQYLADLPNKELIDLKSQIEKEIEKRRQELDQASDFGLSSAG